MAFYMPPYCVLLLLATTVSVARGETARAATVVLMIDTHRPLPLPSKMSLVHYSALAAVVNAHYACVHGFDFLYMRRSEPGCTHPRFGRRHPSYCKLPAVAATTMADGRIDSDSWFAPGAAPPIETLVGAAERRLQHAAERRARGACRPNAALRASLAAEKRRLAMARVSYRPAAGATTRAQRRCGASTARADEVNAAREPPLPRTCESDAFV